MSTFYENRVRRVFADGETAIFHNRGVERAGIVFRYFLETCQEELLIYSRSLSKEVIAAREFIPLVSNSAVTKKFLVETDPFAINSGSIVHDIYDFNSISRNLEIRMSPQISKIHATIVDGHHLRVETDIEFRDAAVEVFAPERGHRARKKFESIWARSDTIFSTSQNAG